MIVFWQRSQIVKNAATLHYFHSLLETFPVSVFGEEEGSKAMGKCTIHKRWTEEEDCTNVLNTKICYYLGEETFKNQSWAHKV